MALQPPPETAPDSTRRGRTGLEQQGLTPAGTVHWNSITPELMEAAARRGEGD